MNFASLNSYALGGYPTLSQSLSATVTSACTVSAQAIATHYLTASVNVTGASVTVGQRRVYGLATIQGSILVSAIGYKSKGINAQINSNSDVTAKAILDANLAGSMNGLVATNAALKRTAYIAGSIVSTTAAQAVGIKVLNLDAHAAVQSSTSAQAYGIFAINSAITGNSSATAYGYRKKAITASVATSAELDTSFVLVNDHISTPFHRNIRSTAENRTITAK